MAKLLLDRGANVNQGSANDGTTALLFASMKGHLDVAHLLLNRGADPNIERHDGTATALFAAADLKHADMVTLLLDRGADPNGLVDGETPAIVASWHGQRDIVGLRKFAKS